MIDKATKETPVEDALAAGGVFPTNVVTKLRLLREIGWPDARKSLVDDRGRRLLVKADDHDPAIWELKCKPSCWRLYFHVYEASKRFAFVHVVCKKQDAQDDGESARARKVFDTFGTGRSALTEFPLEMADDAENSGGSAITGERRVVSRSAQRDQTTEVPQPVASRRRERDGHKPAQSRSNRKRR